MAKAITLFLLMALYLPAMVISVSYAAPIHSKHNLGLKLRHKPKTEHEYNQALSTELSQMAEQDQKIRRKYPSMPTDPKAAYEAGYENGYIEAENTTKLKQIIRQYGWPSKDMVGSVGTDNAWLLVQHSDNDRAFQAQCLPLIRAAVLHGEAPADGVAYLTDRVLSAQGKPQIYGTQFRSIVNGQVTFKPIQDETQVDSRRKQVGLPALSEYEKQIVQAYGANWPVKPLKQ